jgi:hypothetical protein
VRYNGVAIMKRRRFGDFIAPFDPDELDDQPGFKDCTGALLRSHVSNGDRICVIGGGWGVAAVIAAKEAGESGQVYVYEPEDTQYLRTKSASDFNRTRAPVNTEHAYVGPLGDVDGGEVNARNIDPSDLPEHDLLQLDCEGAEASIIRNIESNPIKIIVETHGFRGTPTSETKAALREKGYTIENTLSLSAGYEYSQENDAYLIFARYTNGEETS